MLCAAFMGLNACKCKRLTAKEAYCAAKWVSHVYISTQHPDLDEKNNEFENAEIVKPSYIRYDVNHIEVFKVPDEFPNGTLPSVIYTPSESATCGVYMRVSKDYLLTGSVRNGSLVTILCGHIVEPASQKIYLEWSETSEELRRMLRKYKFEPCEK